LGGPPRPAGTAITFTANASGGSAPLQYKWWVYDGNWNVVSNWSTSNTFTWTPSTASGAYRIAVWVRNAGSTADSYDNANSNGSIGYVITAGAAPLTLSSLTANASSPQVTGTAVTFSAAAGGGTAPYQFKWRVSTDGGASFTTVQDWSTTSTFTWTPGAPIGDARITVWARNNEVTSDTAQVQATMGYVITSPSAGPLVLNSIVPNLSSPRAVGTTVTFTANASGGTRPYQYKWWILDGSWQVVRDWNTDNTFTWTPASASSAYRVAVWVRNAGSSQDAYDNANSNASIAFVVVP
jgi:N-acetylmuramoyl-L-alanine amidase